MHLFLLDLFICLNVLTLLKLMVIHGKIISIVLDNTYNDQTFKILFFMFLKGLNMKYLFY